MAHIEPIRILVTGYSGLIGTTLAISAPGSLSLIPVADPPQTDITQSGSIAEVMDEHPGLDGVLHLAAYTDTAAAHEQDGDESGSCYRVNVLGTREVARACSDRGLHLIHISTDYVFAGDRDEPWTEKDTPSPIDWYGKTKALAEQEARGAPSWTIVRLAFPYGPNPFGRDLVGKLLGALRKGNEPLRLFDDQFITPTFLPDIAAGLIELCQHRPANEIYHLTGSDWITPYALGHSIANTFDLPSDRIEASKLAGALEATGRPRHRYLKMDNSKWSEWAATVGLSAPVGVREGLRKTRESDAEIRGAYE